MPKTKVEVYDKDQLIYPYIESDHVTFSNGMKVTEMLDQSISMPAVTHEDLSFKVGVGDQDVSSAIVDSSVSEMTIKGKTYQNILPEPSTHVLTNNKEMFKVNEGLDPNVEIVDGVSKSAILKGNTLINMAKQREAEVIFNDRYQHYMVINNVQPGGLIHGEYIYMSMEVNIHEINIETPVFRCISSRETGGYLFIVKSFDEIKNMPKNTWIRISTIRQVKENESLDNYSLQFGLNGEHPTVSGEQVARVSFRNPIWINLTKIYGNGNEPTLTECDNIPYFEGMASVKAPTLHSVGKNLFNINGNINEKYDRLIASDEPNIVEGTTIIPSSKSAYHHGKGQKIKIKKGGTYTFSFTTSDEGIVDIYGPNSEYYVSNKTSTFTFTAPADCDEVLVAFSTNGSASGGKIHNFQIEEGSAATPYEPYKTNILSTPEEVELRGIDDVKDTLNCLTGEVIERIGEYTIDGNENWEIYGNFNVDGHKSFITTISGLSNLYTNSISFISGDFKTGSWNDYVDKKAEEMVWNHDPNKIGIKVKNETASNVTELKAYLASNPIRFNYKLATPVIKTVDLSTSGNWEKIVLNGSENWVLHNNSGDYVEFRCGNMVNNIHDSRLGFSDKFPVSTGGRYERVTIANGTTYITVKNNKAQSVEQLQSWLSQNPMTVWYQIATILDSTQVKQPIFFKDGHIIQSSRADNSLIPTLDYQAKTSNSYVMDLMKTNTRYTMKASDVSGTATIGNAGAFTLNTNRTFISPSNSLFGNKLLVVKGSATDFMIIEGDVTSKTIPYFKGIKSAFEGESKIEVLSTGKNLYPYGDSTFIPEGSGWYFVNGDRQTLWGEKVHKDCGQGAWFYLDEGRYYFSIVNNNNVQTLQVVGDKERLYGDGKLMPSGWYTLRMSVKNANEEVNITNIMVEKDTKTTYEPYKSNITKIPLSSPLRSLPNGVCDELIIDRMKNKATLIQRVGYVMLNGSEEWNLYPSMEQDKTLLFQTKNPTVDGKNAYCVSDKYFHSPSLWSGYYNEGIQLGGSNPISRVDLRVYKGKVSSNNATILREYLSKDPIVVLYELATPIITEVDLEGFPYIYKDGHIFLNSEIAPTTEIAYSINQCQQISASNEDIIRHEKELTYLQKLIAQYVQVDYESVLLSLKI